MLESEKEHVNSYTRVPEFTQLLNIEVQVTLF